MSEDIDKTIKSLCRILISLFTIVVAAVSVNIATKIFETSVVLSYILLPVFVIIFMVGIFVSYLERLKKRLKNISQNSIEPETDISRQGRPIPIQKPGTNAVKSFRFSPEPNYCKQYKKCNFIPYPYNKYYNSFIFGAYNIRPTPHHILLEGIDLGENNVTCDINTTEGKKLKEFQLDNVVANYKDYLLILHKAKELKLKNRPQSRLCDYNYERGHLYLIFEKTTYYNTLFTNDSMKIYIQEEGNSLRNLLEPGPELSELRHSKCSNHLGVSALIICEDGSIPFRFRSAKVALRSYELESSVSGSHKYLPGYFHGKKYNYNIPNPFQAIRAQGFEEASVKEEHIKSIRLIGMSRDVSRGGKPEAFFIIKANFKNIAEFERNARSASDKWEWKSILEDVEHVSTNPKEAQKYINKRLGGYQNQISTPLKTHLFFYFKYLEFKET